MKSSLWRIGLAATAALAGSAWGAAPPPALTQAFEAAWARQPEARAEAYRREAAQARLDSAARLFAAPPSLELSVKTDRMNRDQGSREYEAGVSAPVWLPGERAATRALAQADGAATEARLAAARLRTAGQVREVWWAQARSRLRMELALARERNAARLAADVARRVEAGDLARADGHQAASAAAAARAETAAARIDRADALNTWRALVGMEPPAHPVEPETMPQAAPVSVDDAHPALQELAGLAETARRARTLIGVQTRAHPELRLAGGQERSVAGEAWSQTITLGVRIPLGQAAQQRANTAAAAVEVAEAEGRLETERARLQAAADTARERLAHVRAALVAAETHARLAAATRGFYEKSFRLGETDLPAQLRVEREADDAERQAALARIDVAVAISTLRQALGLMPEQGTHP